MPHLGTTSVLYDGLEEVRRKFFGTLHNTYAFFALYANVDGFKFEEEGNPCGRAS